MEMNYRVLHCQSCSTCFHLCYSVDESVRIAECKMSHFVFL